MKSTSFLVSALAVLSLMGCKATVNGGDLTPPDFPTVPVQTNNPHPIPSSCIDLTGKYQMNSDLFTLKQKGCEQLTWVDEPTYYNPSGSSYVYQADGKERKISDDGKTQVYETAYFSDAGFAYERRTTDGKPIKKKVFYFSKAPCNLMNPDGSNYLTAETYVVGTAKPISCSFWKQTTTN